MAATLDELQRSGVRTALYRDVDWARVVDDLRGYPHNALIILYLAEPTYGHYVCLLRRDNALELFDSTAREPDQLRGGLSPALASKLGQYRRQLVRAMRAARDRDGLALRYNDIRIQPDGRDPETGRPSETCGWWCLLRALHSDLDEYQFVAFVEAEAARAGVCPNEYVRRWGARKHRELSAPPHTMAGRGKLTLADDERLDGLVGGDAVSLGAQRPLSTLPAEALSVVDMMRFPQGPEVVQADMKMVGSFTLAIQGHPSDLDLDCQVLLDPKPATRDHTGAVIAAGVQAIAARVARRPGAFFSDVKAGVDAHGDAMHWTAAEVKAGRHRGGQTLAKACANPTAVCKLDAIVPLLGRYVECSAFYHVRTPAGPFNFKAETPAAIADALRADAKGLIAGDPPKYFKAVKRLFSAAKLEGDDGAMGALAPLIESGVSQLGAAAGDLETLMLIVEHGGLPERRLALSSISQLAFKLSSVLDVEGFDPAGFAAEAKQGLEFLYAGDRSAFLATYTMLVSKLRALTNRAVLKYFAALRRGASARALRRLFPAPQ